MTTLTHSHRTAITARYLGPTNYRGARIRVHRADATFAADPMARTIGWDHALDASDNYRAAIAAYVDAHNAAGHAWSGRWVLGSRDDGAVAVWVDDEPTSDEPTWYAIGATYDRVVTDGRGDQWTGSGQVPTFYVSGAHVIDERAAEDWARRVVRNASTDPAITYHVHAVKLP